MSTQTLLMDTAAIDATLSRMADEILSLLEDPSRLALIGIRTAGVFLGQRLATLLTTRLGRPVRFGSLDITLYRDDLYTGLEKPDIGPTDITFSIDGLEVVLVDDVLFTGRTVRAALDELMDLGRPKRILLAVLMDRGHRELPVMANVVGRSIQTTKQQRVLVQLREDARYRQDQVTLSGSSQESTTTGPRDERLS